MNLSTETLKSIKELLKSEKYILPRDLASDIVDELLDIRFGSEVVDISKSMIWKSAACRPDESLKE